MAGRCERHDWRRDDLGSRMPAFEGYPLWINLVVFAGAAAVVWVAGSSLSRYADVIADRTGLGQAFAGMLLLATVTSLPELATTVTATAAGSLPLAVANLLGGVSMQTAILAIVDGVIVGRGALTRRSPQPALLLQGLLVVALLAVTLAALALGGGPALGGIGVGSAVLVLLYVIGMYTTHAYEGHPRWRPIPSDGEPAAASEEEARSVASPARGTHGTDGTEEERGLRGRLRGRFEGTSTARVAAYFAAAAAVILAAGWTVARVADALAEQTGLGATLVGFVLVATTTSLPEVSTTVSAARLGAYGMAIGNILGSNAFDTTLLAVADVVHRDGPILAAAEPWTAFAAALGILVTCAYLWGLVERSNRTVLRRGLDSATVLALYVGGVVVLYLVR